MATNFEKIKQQIKEKNLEREISPIERLFMNKLYDCRIFEEHFEREYPEPPYSIDFAFPNIKVAVELDGREYHKDKEKDDKKDEHLRNLGWDVIRITGSDIVKKRYVSILRGIFDDLFPDREYPYALLEMLSNKENKKYTFKYSNGQVEYDEKNMTMPRDFLKFKPKKEENRHFCDYCNSFHDEKEECKNI
jgi:very-short-patch-repair endonuclease